MERKQKKIIKRALIYIPIFHSLEELKDGPDKIYRKQLGKEYNSFSKDFGKRYKIFWQKINRHLEKEKIHKIYQDSYSFPYLFPGHFIEMFNPSPNSKILTKLIKKGGHMVKADSFFYKLTGDIDKRDNHILNRINHTLKQGETGVLFMGAGHKIKEKIRSKSFNINLKVFDAGIISLIKVFKKYFPK